jgi:hypothetical protein
MPPIFRSVSPFARPLLGEYKFIAPFTCKHIVTFDYK